MKNKKFKCKLCGSELNTHNDILLIYHKATKAICFDCINYDLLEKIKNKDNMDKFIEYIKKNEKDNIRHTPLFLVEL